MINELELNSARFLQLENDIRITANSTFNAQEAYENTFEDVLLEHTTKESEQEKTNNVNFWSLGAPAGFFLDTSLLDERLAMEEANQTEANC